VPARSRSQAGYTMALLIIVMTVMITIAAASLPLWSKLIQHDNEEELISRGWQYVEAIRVYQKRFGHFPVTLDEMIKAQPRTLRHRYLDPMTGKDFLPIYLNQPVMPPTATGLGPSGSSGPFGSSGPSSASGPSGPSGIDPENPDNPVQTTAGPIIGVRSRSTKTSALTFFGQTRYDQWLFTVDLLRSAQAKTVQLSTRWLGRPMQYANPPGMTAMPPGSPLPGSSGPFGPSGGSGASGPFKSPKPIASGTPS
jgi:type II secretory pathway pseudopilin PulG